MPVMVVTIQCSVSVLFYGTIDISIVLTFFKNYNENETEKVNFDENSYIQKGI